MRITNNTLSESIVRQIQQLGTNQAKLQTQVATGQRIFNPEDNPTAVGRVLGLESEQRLLDQFSRNAARALELSQATFSALQQVKKVSDRATEVGTLGAGAIGPDASKAYASEIDQMIEHTLQLGNTRFRNDHLFAGTAVNQPPFVATRDAAGKLTGVAYAGNADRAGIQLSETASIAPGSTNDTNLGLRDFLNQLVALRDALETGNTAAVSSVQPSLIASEDKIVSALAGHGGVQLRIEANRAQQQQRSDNLESLISGEVDADMPTTIVRLNQSQTAYQAALQSAANIMRLSLLDYIQ
jgi:flagellar hook-associated protein 3 FlgL